METNIGEKIKELRTKRGMTLKEFGEKVELSTGYLSQLERGLTTVSVDVLKRVAAELGVELNYFFKEIKTEKKIVMRSYEKEVFQVVSSQIYYYLSNDLTDKVLVPRFVELLPRERHEKIEGFPHEGEEFVYVLEGTLTLGFEGREEILHPGDSAHYSSNTLHNWENDTSKMTRLITVGTPNTYQKKFS